MDVFVGIRDLQEERARVKDLSVTLASSNAALLSRISAAKNAAVHARDSELRSMAAAR